MLSGQQHQERAAGNSAVKQARGFEGYLNSPYSWLAVFILSLNIRFWFNFQAPHLNAYGACDASEYIRNALAINGLTNLPTSFWQDSLACLLGQATQTTQDAIRQTLSSLAELKISSPVFPSFVLAAFFLTGNSFDMSNWMLMLGVQSFIAAITSVLIAHTAALIFDRKIGFTAGILSAVYPGFIINSGRLYSETFAVFLTTLLVWLVVKDFLAANSQNARPQNAFVWSTCQILKGVVAISLQLTRSIMVVATLALLPATLLTYRQNKTKIIAAFLLISLGFAGIAMPWLALQKLAFGSATLIVDRVGHYNFFVGNNAETQGWLSVPYPDGRGIEEKSLLTLWQEEVKKSPSAWLRLTQDKLPRLLKFPWNDFRCSIGPFGICQQVTMHQLILLLGVIGISLSLFGDVLKRSNRPQIFCRLMIFSLIAFQLIYCFFITVPRYNLAIMPFLIMFAAAGLISLWRLMKNARSAKTAISIAAIAVALFGISRVDSSTLLIPQPIIITAKAIILLALSIALWQAINWLESNKKKNRALIIGLLAISFVPFCLPVRAHGRALEWQQRLANDSITQTISLSAQDLNKLNKKNNYLLIDSEDQARLINDASISINGKHLTGPFIPSLSFINDTSHVVPIGQNLVAFEQEYIFDCMTQEAATCNANLRQWYLLPIPRQILTGTPMGKDGRYRLKIRISADENALPLFGSVPSDRNVVTIPSLTRYSWEKAFYGVENTHGLTDSRYDQKVKLTTPAKKMLNVFLLSDDVQIPQDEAVTLVAKVSETKDIELALPEYDNEEIWLVRLAGQTRSQKDSPSQAGLTLSIKCQDKNAVVFYKSPWCQKLIQADAGSWRKFDCVFPLQPSTLPGTALSLQGHFLPVSELNEHMNKPQNPAPAEVRNLTAQILHFPAMPFKGNYKLHLGQESK